MTLRIPKSQADALGLDLTAAVRSYGLALTAHSKTVNKPAPVAHPLVEEIVKAHSGTFEVFDDRTPADHRQDALRSISLSAQALANEVLSPARQQLAAIDQNMLVTKPNRTAQEELRLAEIERQFATLFAIQRHAAVLAVELDELPENQIATWQPHGWPAF